MRLATATLSPIQASIEHIEARRYPWCAGKPLLCNCVSLQAFNLLDCRVVVRVRLSKTLLVFCIPGIIMHVLLTI